MGAPIKNPMLLKKGGRFPDVTLLAGYVFEEQTGTSLEDVSGNLNTGTLTSAALWSGSGKVAGGIVADGTNYIVVGTDNSMGLSGTTFGHAFWVFVPVGGTTTNVWLTSAGFNTSGSVSGDNKGYCAYYTDLGLGYANLNFAVRSGTSVTSGNYFRGFWETGLTLDEGWNLVIVNRRTNGADAWVRNATSGETSNTISGSFGSLTYESAGTAEDILNGADTRSGSPMPSAANFRRDCEYFINAEWSADDRDRLWNNGNGVQP